MRLFRSGAFVAASLLLLAPPVATQSTPVSIQFQDGNVTIRTSGRMPLRTVLQEWARVGRAKIVNAESVTATLDQIELVNVPEQKALAVLLRDISGYAIGARDVSASGALSVPNGVARFDRIMLSPKTASLAPAPRAGAVVSTVPAPPPINFVAGDPDDDPNNIQPGVRALTPVQQQNNANVAAARAAAAAAAGVQQPNSDRNPSEVQPPPTPATNQPTNANPFFSGRTGRPGEINPVPQQQRNPLRPNGDPEP